MANQSADVAQAVAQARAQMRSPQVQQKIAKARTSARSLIGPVTYNGKTYNPSDPAYTSAQLGLASQLNPKSTPVGDALGTIASSALEWISRPSYVVGNAIQGDFGSAAKNLGNFFVPGSQAIEPIAGARTSPSAALESRGIHFGGGPIGFIGRLATDVALDPLTYLTFGTGAVLKGGEEITARTARILSEMHAGEVGGGKAFQGVHDAASINAKIDPTLTSDAARAAGKLTADQARVERMRSGSAQRWARSQAKAEYVAARGGDTIGMGFRRPGIPFVVRPKTFAPAALQSARLGKAFDKLGAVPLKSSVAAKMVDNYKEAFTNTGGGDRALWEMFQGADANARQHMADYAREAQDVERRVRSVAHSEGVDPQSASAAARILHDSSQVHQDVRYEHIDPETGQSSFRQVFDSPQAAYEGMVEQVRQMADSSVRGRRWLKRLNLPDYETAARMFGDPAETSQALQESGTVLGDIHAMTRRLEDYADYAGVKYDKLPYPYLSQMPANKVERDRLAEWLGKNAAPGEIKKMREGFTYSRNLPTIYHWMKSDLLPELSVGRALTVRSVAGVREALNSVVTRNYVDLFGSRGPLIDIAAVEQKLGDLQNVRDVKRETLKDLLAQGSKKSTEGEREAAKVARANVREAQRAVDQAKKTPDSAKLAELEAELEHRKAALEALGTTVAPVARREPKVIQRWYESLNRAIVGNAVARTAKAEAEAATSKRIMDVAIHRIRAINDKMRVRYEGPLSLKMTLAVAQEEVARLEQAISPLVWAIAQKLKNDQAALNKFELEKAGGRGDLTAERGKLLAKIKRGGTPEQLVEWNDDLLRLNRTIENFGSGPGIDAREGFIADQMGSKNYERDMLAKQREGVRNNPKAAKKKPKNSVGDYVNDAMQIINDGYDLAEHVGVQVRVGGGKIRKSDPTITQDMLNNLQQTLAEIQSAQRIVDKLQQLETTGNLGNRADEFEAEMDRVFGPDPEAAAAEQSPSEAVNQAINEAPAKEKPYTGPMPSEASPQPSAALKFMLTRANNAEMIHPTVGMFVQEGFGTRKDAFRAIAEGTGQDVKRVAELYAREWKARDYFGRDPRTVDELKDDFKFGPEDNAETDLSSSQSAGTDLTPNEPAPEPSYALQFMLKTADTDDNMIWHTVNVYMYEGIGNRQSAFKAIAEATGLKEGLVAARYFRQWRERDPNYLEKLKAEHDAEMGLTTEPEASKSVAQSDSADVPYASADEAPPPPEDWAPQESEFPNNNPEGDTYPARRGLSDDELAGSGPDLAALPSKQRALIQQVMYRLEKAGGVVDNVRGLSVRMGKGGAVKVGSAAGKNRPAPAHFLTETDFIELEQAGLIVRVLYKNAERTKAILPGPVFREMGKAPNEAIADIRRGTDQAIADAGAAEMNAADARLQRALEPIPGEQLKIGQLREEVTALKSEGRQWRWLGNQRASLERMIGNTKVRLAKAKAGNDAEAVKEATNVLKEMEAARREADNALDVASRRADGRSIAKAGREVGEADAALEKFTAAAGRAQAAYEESLMHFGTIEDAQDYEFILQNYETIRNRYVQRGTAADPNAKVLFDPQVIGAIRRIDERINPTIKTQNAFRKMARFVKSITRMWKGLVLATPGYHMRNLFDDSLRAYWAGARDPRTFWQARNILRAQRKGGDLRAIKVKIGDRTYTGEEVLSMAQTHGVIGTGSQYTSEATPLYERSQAGSIPYWKGKRKTIARPGEGKLATLSQDIGALREDLTRLGTFMELMKGGKSELHAAEDTRDFLFDYNDTSDFVNEAKQFWGPFVTYATKAIPLYAKTAIQRPGQLAALGYAMSDSTAAARADYGNKAVDLSIMPPGQELSFAVPRIPGISDWLNGGSEQAGSIDPTSFLGIGAINQAIPITFGGDPGQSDFANMTGSIPGAGGRMIGNFINPFVRAGIEVATNRDLRFGSQLPERARLTPLLNAANQIGVPLPNAGMKKDSYTGQEAPGMSSAAMRIYKLIPPFSQADSYLSLIGSIPGVGPALTGIPGGTPIVSESDTGRVPFVRTLGGLPYRPIDVQRAQFYASKQG